MFCGEMAEVSAICILPVFWQCIDITSFNLAKYIQYQPGTNLHLDVFCSIVEEDAKMRQVLMYRFVEPLLLCVQINFPQVFA